MLSVLGWLALSWQPPVTLVCFGLDYRNSGKTELAGPADAALFRAAFETHFEARGTTISNPDRTQLINGIREAIRMAPAGGQLVIYFSGHGAQIPDSKRSSGFRQALVPRDFKLIANRLDPASLLDGPQIGALLAEGSALRQIVLVIDACHSTALTRGRLIPKSLSLDALPAAEGAPTFDVGTGANVTVLAACQSHQKAYQLNGGGVFTRALVGSLADLRRQRRDALTTWGDLIAEVRARISWEISGAQISADAQVPQLEGRLDQEAFGVQFRPPDGRFPVVVKDGEWSFQAGRAQGIDTGFLVEVRSSDQAVQGVFPVEKVGISQSTLGGAINSKVGLQGEVVDRTPDNRIQVRLEMPPASASAATKGLTDPSLPRLFSIGGADADFVVKEAGAQWQIYGDDLAAPRATCNPDTKSLRQALNSLSRLRALQRLQSPPDAQVLITMLAVPLRSDSISPGATTLDLSVGDRFVLKVMAKYADGTTQKDPALAQRDGRYVYLHSLLPNGQIEPLWPVVQEGKSFRFQTSQADNVKIVPDGRWRWVGALRFVLTDAEDGKPIPIEMAPLPNGDSSRLLPRLKDTPQGYLASMRFSEIPGGFGQFETIKLLATSTPVDANQWLSPAASRSVTTHRLMKLLESFTDGQPRSRNVGVGDWAAAEVRIHPAK